MDTKSKIIETAILMFTKYGIRNVTMDSIAAELMISKRTLYKHFKNKEDLLIKAIETKQETEHEICKTIIDNSDNIIDAIFKIEKRRRTEIEKINPIFFEDLEKMYSSILLKSIKTKNPELTLSLLERGVKENLIKKEINLEILTAFIYKIITILNDEVFKKFKKEEIKTSIFMPFFDGITTKKGKLIIQKNINNL